MPRMIEFDLGCSCNRQQMVQSRSRESRSSTKVHTQKLQIIGSLLLALDGFNDDRGCERWVEVWEGGVRADVVEIEPLVARS